MKAFGRFLLVVIVVDFVLIITAGAAVTVVATVRCLAGACW